MRILPYGCEAVLVDLELIDATDRANRTHTCAKYLQNRFPQADVVVGGGVVVLVGQTNSSDVAAACHASIPELASSLSPQKHILPIVFDGPDLDEVLTLSGLSRDEIVESLVKPHFLVELIGFLPGFGYLGPLDPRLVLPRRKAPRPRVPAQSLAIAGGFAGIYPFVSPGGWHLLGRSLGPALFDPSREKPFLFAPGDHVQFETLNPADAAPIETTAPNTKMAPPESPAFVVEVAPACATIQDAGRRGQLHFGLPPSGPLDPDTFVNANLAVGNAEDEAAIEIPLGRFVIRASRDLVISLDGDECIFLKSGDRLEVPENDRAVRYLAFRGGIDVPIVLGSRSTLLVARVGGFSGRPLRKGDVLAIADRATHELPKALPNSIETTDEIKIVVDPGPHLDRLPPEAFDVLSSSTYSISTMGDRVGVRLDGPKIPRSGLDSALPVPMIRGAMQITTDGTPIIFGPDHPTTGGYPVLAVVRRSSWGKLARLRPGTRLRFITENRDAS